jgi:hypothetical protein
MPQRFSTEDDAFTEDVAEQLRKSLPATVPVYVGMPLIEDERIPIGTAVVRNENGQVVATVRFTD